MHPPVLLRKSLLTDKVKFTQSYWDDIGDEAKDFVKLLLEKCAGPPENAELQLEIFEFSCSLFPHFPGS